MKQKQWQYYPDSCRDCGGDVEVFTDSDKEGFVFDDDLVRCCDVECGAKGIITIFGEDAVEIQWDETAANALREAEG